MVELDVRHNRNLGRQRKDSAIRLVALDHEVARTEPGIRAKLWHRCADQPRRIPAGLPEHEGDHRGRRSLAVGARDDDRGSARDKLAQELRATQPRHFRVRRRHDRLPPCRHVWLGRDLDLDVAEQVEVRRPDPIPAADRRAPRPRQLGIGTQARSSDPDEPELAAVHCRAIATSSSAISSAACGLAAVSIAALIRARRAPSSSSERTSSGT